ncbi:class I SAM-dependent methyltransferase [Candidatus Poribacteria bacterium]|nr:class I SAM-dependent methyltransferase [Candidatus Poribacteria bacterium]
MNRIEKIIPWRLKKFTREQLVKFRLRREENVLRAVLRTFRNECDSEENVQFTLIENLREEMIRANRPVEMVYYGAGGPTKGLSDEEIRAGVKVSETTEVGIPRISSPSWKGQLLFRLIRECSPENVLELGTGYGISGLYQISALKLNGKGYFYTIDGSRENQAIASEMFLKLKSNCWSIIYGQLPEILTEVLEQVGTVDFVLIDADHSYKGTRRYFEMILPHLSKGGVLVFDDITWSRDMYRAWQEISNNSKVKSSTQVRKVGICIKA